MLWRGASHGSTERQSSIARQLERRHVETRMRNQSAILKRLEKIESAIQGIVNTVIRVIGDEPMPEDNDSTLIIRRVLVKPTPILLT